MIKNSDNKRQSLFESMVECKFGSWLVYEQDFGGGLPLWTSTTVPDFAQKSICKLFRTKKLWLKGIDNKRDIPNSSCQNSHQVQ